MSQVLKFTRPVKLELFLSDCLCAVLNLYKLIKFQAKIGFVL